MEHHSATLVTAGMRDSCPRNSNSAISPSTSPVIAFNGVSGSCGWKRSRWSCFILLVEHGGELVSREEIAKRLWDRDVFLDVDHSINTAVRKIRTALRDDSEKPRFVETVVGKGYRFAAPVIGSNGAPNAAVLPSWPPRPDGPIAS